MMSKMAIALAAAATLFAASALEASARPGGGGGGGGRSMGGGGGGGFKGASFGSGGMRSSGGMGMRSSGFVGGNRSFVGVNRSFVGSGVVRSGNIARFSGVRSLPMHTNRIAMNNHPRFRNRFFVGGGYGYGYGYNSCLRQVWGVYGLTWVNVCAYPDYYNY